VERGRNETVCAEAAGSTDCRLISLGFVDSIVEGWRVAVFRAQGQDAQMQQTEEITMTSGQEFVSRFAKQRSALWLSASVSIVAAITAAGFAAPFERPKPQLEGIREGKVEAEIRTVFTVADGLPSDDVYCVAAVAGDIFAGTSQGLARFDGHKWSAVKSVVGPVKLLAPRAGGEVFVASADGLRLVKGDTEENVVALPAAAHSIDDLQSLAVDEVAGRATVLLGTRSGLFEIVKLRVAPVEPLNNLLGPDKNVRHVAIASDGRIAVAASEGLFLGQPWGSWERPNPVDRAQSWWPRDVRGVAFDARDRLWFASPAGVGCLDGKIWTLYTGQEGLPYNDFTTIASGPGKVVWFGTRLGAIRFDGSIWNYRQGHRWLPDDDVRSMAVGTNSDAWFATAHGVGRLGRRPTTLAEKAALFEAMIDKYHRRTPYGFVCDVHLPHPGDLSSVRQHDDDNDGLWTGMYGAGECFAYAATHDPLAKKRAKAAFEALRFLSQVTQGGAHPAPKGFPARSIRSTSGADPNQEEKANKNRRRERQRERDPRDKVLTLHWPTSADGKWYWKSDTSSDELDGHYFLNACYYDLVADSEAERQRVRDVVADMTDHLLDHKFDLIDHDGKPTRWGRFGPATLNGLSWVEERGLNSLSILSYLAVAEHMTGQKRFRDAFHFLAHDQAYLANLEIPKMQSGPATGNQSDDEMAFMCYFNLLRCGTDPQVRRAANVSLRRYWSLEEPERSPLFNYICAAVCENDRRTGRPVPETCLTDALDFLKRYPFDRLDWGFKNSHRLDIVRLPRFQGRNYQA
jgi:hypothetical protein